MNTALTEGVIALVKAVFGDILDDSCMCFFGLLHF